MIVHTLLVDYCEVRAQPLAEKLEKYEFYDIPGNIHVQVFQTLLDGIMQMNSFRAYINDVPERKAGNIRHFLILRFEE